MHDKLSCSCAHSAVNNVGVCICAASVCVCVLCACPCCDSPPSRHTHTQVPSGTHTGAISDSVQVISIAHITARAIIQFSIFVTNIARAMCMGIWQ